MSDDLFYGDVYGKELTTGRPEGHLADLDSQNLATAERVRHARLYWRERDPAEFEAYGTTGRKVVDRLSGERYVVAEHDPFQVERPQEDTVTCFVQNGGWIFYLKPRGVDKSPGGVGLSAAVIGGELTKDWAGRPQLVDGNGNVTRLIEGGRR